MSLHSRAVVFMNGVGGCVCVCACVRECVCSQNGWTGFILASQNGHLEVVKLLLDKGADVNKADKVNEIPTHSQSPSAVQVPQTMSLRDKTRVTCLNCFFARGPLRYPYTHIFI